MMRSTYKDSAQVIDVTPPTEEEIRKRAFEIYVRRGKTPGKEKEDWTHAESELRDEKTRARRPR